MDPYKILGVERSANADTIKKAYRKLASREHPDKGGDTSRFQEIQAAYDILSDPQKRHDFDNPRPQFHGRHPNNFDFHFNFGGDGIHDIFEQMRNGGDPFGFPRQQRRNRDIRSSVTIPIRDTLVEQRKILSVKNSNGGTRDLEMVIPRGVTPGTVFRFAQQGEQNIPHLPPGDLLVNINILQDPDFEVHGLDLSKCLKIDAWDAMIGCERQVTGLDGRSFIIKIPSGCQWGTKLRVMGEGLWAFQKDVKGNLIIRVEVEIPQNLSEEEKNYILNLKSRH